MERYAVDFGTSNTVVARWNFAKEEPQTMSFPAITAPGSSAPHLPLRGPRPGVFRRPYRAAVSHPAAGQFGAERRYRGHLYRPGQCL